MANSLDFHATDPQHLLEVHQHSDDYSVDGLEQKPYRFVKKTTNPKNITDSHHNPTDCHHCGHCSGTHIQWIVQHALQSNRLALQTHQFYYLRTTNDVPVNQLLRP